MHLIASICTSETIGFKIILCVNFNHIRMQYDLSILFFLKKGQIDKKGEIPIYLRITVNGERAEISTNRKIELIHYRFDVKIISSLKYFVYRGSSGF